MREQEFMTILGNNIRLFRNRAKLTQGQLADKIGRSLASISKYERGECAIDSYTLFSIANVLNVTTSQLLPEASFASEEHPMTKGLNLLSEHRVLYLYNIAHITQKLSCSVIEIDWTKNEAIMYVSAMDPKKSDYRQCSMILYGKIISASACISIWVNNPSAPIDYFHIVVNGADWYSGNHACYISYATMNWRTVTCKGVLTTTPECPPDIEKQLELTKQELKQIRQTNQLLI